jgi:hypothetical protein
MKQCSEKYKAAQSSGAAGSMTWSEFRAEECGTDATMELKKAIAPKGESAGAGPSMQECSSRYQAAKTANTLGGMSWNEFRKAGCVAKTAATAPAGTEHRKSAKRQATHVEPAANPKAATGSRMSEQECSSRYQAAKAADTLGGISWNEFRKAGCPATIARRSGSVLPTSGSIYPAAISRKYSSLPEGRARELTCRDQYEANKAAGVSEMKWTEQGGGYYSECNKRLSAH